MLHAAGWLLPASCVHGLAACIVAMLLAEVSSLELSE